MSSGADLSGADLWQADLRFADLSNTNLSHADLSGANLKDANLTDANLNRAKGISNEVLHQQAASLEGATMPNGQKYADWRKSKDRGEDR